MNLNEAQKRKRLAQFIKEHEVKDPHPMGKERFDTLMDLMTRAGKSPTAGTSDAVPSAGCAATRTRRGTSANDAG